MAIVRIFAVLLIVLWLVLWLLVKITFVAIHLLLAAGVVLLAISLIDLAKSKA
jgi:hypothetical protein